MATTDEAIELSGVGTLTGTPEQVRSGLSRLHAERVVALTLEHGNDAAVRALAETVANLAPLVRTILERRQHEALESIIEALVPDVPPPQHKLVEARMTAESRKAVLESGDWLTAAQIAEMAGFSTTNPSAQPNKWKKDGQIFAVRHRGVDYFPGYALDTSTDYRPAKGLPGVLAVFRGRKDGWGLAYWFASVNRFFAGERPADLLIGPRAAAVAAAEDAVPVVLHG